MLPTDAKVISVDDHVVEPPTVWTERLPAKYRDEGPHIVEVDGHRLAWQWEDRQYLMQLMGSPETRNFRSDGTGEDFWARHYDDMVPGAYEVNARVAAMDEDGIHAQLLFPTFPRFAGTRFLEGKDKELARLCVSAWNDWILDEWCPAAPDRFIPMVMIPMWDAAASAAEIRRCAAKGAKSVTFPENPAPLGLPSYWTDVWDQVFDAAEETNTVLSMHIGTSGSLVSPSPESSEAVGISLCGVNSMSACTDLIYSGLLQRHPNIKIALSEGGAGWVPYALERMDYTWERTRLGVDKSVPPSELFRRHFWTCVISDHAAVEQREAIGVDKLMFESDYPHNDSNWPNSRKVLAEMLLDVPDDDARRIAETNARELYDFFA